MIVGAALALALTAAQAHWLTVSYNIGQEYGLGYTVAGLAWQESSFCQRQINSWSRGCLGIKRSVARLFDPTVTRAELETDNDRNIRDGLAYLLYCNTHTRDWKQMVYAYHWGLPKALAANRDEIVSDGYVNAVAAKVKQLQAIQVSTSP